MNKHERLNMHTQNLANEKFSTLVKMFPNAVTEAIRGYDENGEAIIERSIDADVLSQEINTHVVAGKEERYQFTWPDKKKSVLLANSPLAATLRPCREESVDFDTTENLYIEGDNLDVLKLLRETYLNRVKMIYIDPPYNTGNDFIYEDDFAEETGEFLRRDGQFDQQGNRLISNFDSNGRFHTDWLNMIYPRLRMARDLLMDDGVMLISIDDNEVENLKKICNEVFGSSNFVDCITWNTRVPKNDNKGLGNIHQYILVYVKQSQRNRQFMMPKDGLDEISELLEKMKKQSIPIPEAEEELKKLYNKKGYDRGITLYNSLDESYQPWGKINMSWPNSNTFGPNYDVLHPVTKKPTKKPDRGWRWNQQTFSNNLDYENVIERHDGSFICGNIWFAKDENTQPSSIKYLRDVGKMLLRTIVSLKSDGGVELENIFEGKSFFSNPKPTSLIKLLIESIEEKEGIFLDFFSGSATTAHAIMRLNSEDGGNRKFIMVQIPELCDEKSEAFKAGYSNICEIGKERIRRVGIKIKEEAGLIAQNLDIGFRVLKLDSSNMKDVYYTPEEYGKQGFNLEGFMDNIKPDRTDEDLLFQVMLELGIPLSAKIKQENKEFSVNDNYLIACFERVDTTMITDIAKKQPYYAVFRDSSFINDSSLINVEQIFNTYSPHTIRRVL
ncbi:site-specific DNA-methyltransferase [Gudongella oleilytica]|uniref:site-specific DNA-methyltransferase n=1 Tax=Gudongella oleilytica TaxID=1582259 RepID=UPI0019D07EEA|nr:site-specific DNA-methyltransferase [Gudongella oleilytica]